MLEALLVILLFVRLLQPRTRTAALVLPLAIAALIGSHTFAWTVREAFPINTFLTILLCCAAAANLAFARNRWWVDVLAALLFVVAALTVESGLLVWVIFVGGYLVGLRGVSRTGIAALAVLLAGYVALRFGVLGVGVPGLLERDAGFGFRRYDAAEIQQMFGGTRYVFYVYNVLASILTVLAAEPRDGVWRLTAGVVRQEVDPALVVNVVSSLAASLLIARFAWTRRHVWRTRTFDRRDQLVALFGIVLLANAAISYAYTKDVIVSPAGMFFAAALFAAGVDAVDRLSRPGAARAARAMAWAFLAVLSCGWAVRTVGLHAALSETSAKVRDEWAYVDEFMVRWGFSESDSRAVALKRHLQDDAIVRHPAKPSIRQEWMRAFDTR